jgi:hypothetical protein
MNEILIFLRDHWGYITEDAGLPRYPQTVMWRSETK